MAGHKKRSVWWYIHIAGGIDLGSSLPVGLVADRLMLIGWVAPISKDVLWIL